MGWVVGGVADGAGGGPCAHHVRSCSSECFVFGGLSAADFTFGIFLFWY